jgi:probable HAF family extracellular repeat protein
MHAFLDINGHMQDLGNMPNYRDTLGRAISADGTVVGLAYVSDSPSTVPHAFCYSNGSMQDLNTFIDPSTGWILNDATGINDAGQIIGRGTNALGQAHAYLLTPMGVPEPAALAFLSGGIATVLIYRKKTPRPPAAAPTFTKIKFPISPSRPSGATSSQ